MPSNLSRALEQQGVTGISLSRLHHVCMHPSAGKSDFEKYEFLGDRVIALVVGTELMSITQVRSEGELSRMSSLWVNKYTLAEAGALLGIDKHIKHRGHIKRETLLADGFEALIGAVYLDQGLGVVELLWSKVRCSIEPQGVSNKTTLQEWAHKRGAAPVYFVERTGGTDHNPLFSAVVSVEQRSSSGSGMSKKTAESSAADKFIEEHIK